MKNKISVVLISGLICIVCFMYTGVNASAKETDCSLTLNCFLNTDDGEKPIVGSEFAVIKVADISITESNTKQIIEYQITKRFKEFDCNWNELSFSELHKKAKDISSQVKDSDIVCRQKTDENGSVKLSIQQTGFYLIICTGNVREDVSFSPFLISLPQIINGDLIYHVISFPKFEGQYSEPEQMPDSEYSGDIPQTGQVDISFFLLTAAGLLMIVIGGNIFIRKKG